VHIDAAHAMRYTAQIVGFGPRPIGSEGHRKLEDYLLSHLKADTKDIDTDEFTAQTPAGPFKMRNIIAKFPGKREGIIVIASHYDTLRSVTGFLGANDGGSSTGLLLELADQLHAQKQRDGYSVWLGFFDGEEAVKQWTGDDSLYGSRHLAQKWQADGTTKKIKALLLADMIGDADLKVAKLYNMLPADTGGGAKGRTAADNLTVRTVYVIGPDKKIKLMITYPMATGRNFDEILRVIDSLQLTAKHPVATPVNWKNGEDCIIVTSVSDEDAKKKFPQGWKTLKSYLRLVSQPK